MAFALAGLLLVGCGKPRPYWDQACIASHTESRMQVANGVNSLGQISVGGMVSVPVDVCDRWSEPVCVVPTGAEGGCDEPAP